jgi:hypothetical protein
MPTRRKPARKPRARTVRRNPHAGIGAKIRDAIDFCRGQARDFRERADEIDTAWKEYDYSWLAETGVITASEAKLMLNQ